MSESPTHPDAPRAGGETPALLPCPFCGHPPYVSRSANGTEMLFVGCAVCGIEFKSAWYRDAGNPTRDIVAAWNRRASLLERHRDGEREAMVRLIVESFRDASNPSVEIAVEEIMRTFDGAMSAPPSPERASK